MTDFSNRPMDDRDGYNTDMQKTLGSKLFFLPHVPIGHLHRIVDLGCANAALLKVLYRVAPQADLIGVDLDHHQRKAALENFPSITDIYADLKFLEFEPTTHPSMLIMSSVLHEILSAGPITFDDVWDEIEGHGFRYICLRDFSVPAWAKTCAVPAGWWEAAYINYRDQLIDIHNKFGSTYKLYNFMHFLLKRPYVENWQREMMENYLAVDQEQLQARLTKSGRYEITHRRFTTTKYFRQRTLDDFGFMPSVTTHAEIVLTRSHKERLHHGYANANPSSESVTSHVDTSVSTDLEQVA